MTRFVLFAHAATDETAEGGPDGKKIATANESVIILPGRPWDRPVSPAEETTLES